MKASGLGDVDAVRDEYVRSLNSKLEQAMGGGVGIADIVHKDPTLDQQVMGSANFLYMYLQYHPEIAFILSYTNPQTQAPGEWILTGSREPYKVVRIAHSGSVDGGHFTARPANEFDLSKVQQEYRRKQAL